MKKAETTGENTGDIAVTVTRMGSDPVTVRLAKGATVTDALTAAGVTARGLEYFVDGQRANANDVLEDLDVLALVTPKQAGGDEEEEA